jgi:ATP-dependent DNA helicase RecG
VGKFKEQVWGESGERRQELQVLAELLRERQMTTAELAAVVQRTDAETRTLLTRMVERGWVQARGGGKARSWHLSAAVYRVLDAPSGYVRVQYVQAHGQITRNETAELCGLSPDQASRLLRRLVSASKLGQQGENKGRVYIPAANPNR